MVITNRIVRIQQLCMEWIYSIALNIYRFICVVINKSINSHHSFINSHGQSFCFRFIASVVVTVVGQTGWRRHRLLYTPPEDVFTNTWISNRSLGILINTTHSIYNALKTSKLLLSHTKYWSFNRWRKKNIHDIGVNKKWCCHSYDCSSPFY